MQSQRNVNDTLVGIPIVEWLQRKQSEKLTAEFDDLNATLQEGNKDDLESRLMSLCFSVLDLSDQDQVFIVRIHFNSLITNIIRTQSRKGELQVHVLYKAYEAINVIEKWENISEFILNIPWFAELLVDELLFTFPLVEDGGEHLEKALQLINKHLTDRQLTVNWLARELGISTTHLSNIFKLKLGKNVSEYITARKIKRIAYEIVQTSNSLADIRKKYGFASHSHFIQFFKKHKGMTPLKYRQYTLNMIEE